MSADKHLRRAVRALAGLDDAALDAVTPDAMRAVMTRRGWSITGLGIHHLEGWRFAEESPTVIAYVPTLATSPYGYRVDVRRWADSVRRGALDVAPAEVLAEALAWLDSP